MHPVKRAAIGRLSGAEDAVAELDAVIGEDSVVSCREQPLISAARKLDQRFHAWHSRVKLGERKLRRAIDRHEEVELTLPGTDLSDVDVKIADRVAFEGLLGG